MVDRVLHLLQLPLTQGIGEVLGLALGLFITYKYVKRGSTMSDGQMLGLFPAILVWGLSGNELLWHHHWRGYLLCSGLGILLFGVLARLDYVRTYRRGLYSRGVVHIREFNMRRRAAFLNGICAVLTLVFLFIAAVDTESDWPVLAMFLFMGLGAIFFIEDLLGLYEYLEEVALGFLSGLVMAMVIVLFVFTVVSVSLLVGSVASALNVFFFVVEAKYKFAAFCAVLLGALALIVWGILLTMIGVGAWAFLVLAVAVAIYGAITGTKELMAT